MYIELTWEVWRALYRLQLLSAIASSNSYALVIGFPEGGPRADVGEYGDFMGTLQQISALVVGEMWGL